MAKKKNIKQEEQPIIDPVKEGFIDKKGERISFGKLIQKISSAPIKKDHKKR